MRTGAEIDKAIDRKMFKVTAKKYIWIKSFSIMPRKDSWTDENITPFTFAMRAPAITMNVEIFPYSGPVTDEWITMTNFIYLKLKGIV